VEQKQNPRRSVGPRARGAKMPAERQADEAAFDRWLEAKLKSAYSSVLDEAIPDELARLLEQKLKD